MLSPNKSAISVMVGRLAPKGPEIEGESAGPEIDEGLIVAARDIMVALGQDGGVRDSDSAMQSFEDRSRHLAEALSNFLDVASPKGSSSGDDLGFE